MSADGEEPNTKRRSGAWPLPIRHGCEVVARIREPYRFSNRLPSVFDQSSRLDTHVCTRFTDNFYGLCS
jgi:hypothetical protein